MYSVLQSSFLYCMWDRISNIFVELSTQYLPSFIFLTSENDITTLSVSRLSVLTETDFLACSDSIIRWFARYNATKVDGVRTSVIAGETCVLCWRGIVILSLSIGRGINLRLRIS